MSFQKMFTIQKNRFAKGKMFMQQSHGEPVYFEIAVTHRTDESKWTFYEKGHHNSVEIDIKHLLYEGIPSSDEIRQIIIEDIRCKQVIFWKKEKATSLPLVNKEESQEASPTGFWGILLFLIALVLPFVVSGRRGPPTETLSKETVPP